LGFRKQLNFFQALEVIHKRFTSPEIELRNNSFSSKYKIVSEWNLLDEKTVNAFERKWDLQLKFNKGCM